MAYIGNAPVAGENNSFKILDDISSYTLTFDGSSASVVSTSDNTITYNSHRFITAQRVTYNDGGGTAIGGLADGVYYIIKNDQNTIKLAASEADANTGTAIPLTSLGVGSSHTLNVAFDGVNTKFKATYDNGTKAQISRAAQLMLSVNGVIQQPNDTTTPTNGFGFDLDSVIIFSVAPTATDSFWGNLVANNFPTFDISDNTIDSFTGDNSTVDFTLSKTPANNQNILVTLDGVVQYPSDATNTRAYSVTNNILTFVSAPGNGVAIQVRHIGFAGAVTSAVTGFYGRTGNVGLSTSDNAEVLTLKVGTGTTFTEDLVVQGNARVTGILTIGTASLTLDGTNNQIKIGTGITLTESGSAEYSGIITTSQLNVGTGGTVITTTSDGRIGINSTSPSAETMDIVGTAPKINIDSTNGSSGFRLNIIQSSSQLFRVQNAGTTAFEVNSNGNTLLANGNLVFSTSGTGIDFSATSDATGMTSELLTDYEEGTFTPTFLSAAGGTPPTTQTGTGSYVKIGKVVSFHAQISWTGSGSGGSLLYIEMPFTCISTARGGISIGLPSGFNWTSGRFLNLVPEINSNRIYIIEKDPASGGHVHLTYSNLTNSGSLIFSFGGTIIVP